MAKTALVTGGNRGIGFEVCRELARSGLAVVLTARDRAAGEAAAGKIAGEGGAARFEEMDVSDDRSVDACARRLAAAGTSVDVLVNNAAVYPGERLLDPSTDVLRATMEINFFGASRTCRAFAPGMVARGYGRIVNVSSGSGSFAAGLPGPPVYSRLESGPERVDRQARGRGERRRQGELRLSGVRTRMGGRGASRSVEEGADTIVWLATLPARGPNGAFFRDRKRIAW